MLPSSHFAPINVPLVKDRSNGHVYAQVDDLRIEECVSGENESRDESASQARSAAFLAGEFSEFILAASRLETAYRALQEEVSELGLELSERNAALNTSLAKNEGMRRALQQIVDSMPCGVLVLDRDGQLSMINPESKRLLKLD